MFLLKLFLFALSGFLIFYGLVLQVRGIMRKALSEKTNFISVGVTYKIFGILILAYLIINYKTQDLKYGLISFFVVAFATISWILLARRGRIR